MRFRKSIAVGAATVTAAALAAAVVGSDPAGASSRVGIPTVIVRMNNGHVNIDGGNTLHAGRITFKVVTGEGGHTLQIARFRHGYTLQDAGQDFGKAFGQGDLDAIGRLDDKVIWRGGAGTKPGRPGWFTVTLRHGSFVFFDQNGNGVTNVTVVGEVAKRPTVAHQSKITAFSFGFESEPETIPASGTLYFLNQADQPHFLVIQRVKEGTTATQVRNYVKSGAHRNPPWGLKASRDAGVISPTFGQMLGYDLPAGEYLIACFWPDRFSGMAHFFMGMWKLIHLA